MEIEMESVVGNRDGECGWEEEWRVWVGIGMESVGGNRDGECGWE